MFTKFFALISTLFLSPVNTVSVNNAINADVMTKENIVVETQEIVSILVDESIIDNKTDSEIENVEEESFFDEKLYDQQLDLFNVEDNNSNNGTYGLVIDLDKDLSQNNDIDAISSQLSEKEKQDAETQLALLFTELGL